jgi:hypothetical protein
MDIKYNTPHTEVELREVFRQDNLDEKFYPLFLNIYKKYYNELYKDYKDYEDEYFETDGSIQNSALNVLYMYIEPFLKNIAIGHSEEWSAVMAEYSDEQEHVAFHYAYTGVYEKDPKQAKDELLIHCKYLNADEHFSRYFLYLFESGSGYEEPLTKAEEYSKYYKEQINLGKSAVFAHEYADLMAWGEYVQSYCESYAYAYDKSLQERKSEDYARRFADMYSDRVGENYGRLSDALKDEDFDYLYEKMIGNMRGWEYATENKLLDMESFINSYDNIHINTYCADEPLSPKMSREEIDKMILEKALDRYERRNVKKY